MVEYDKVNIEKQNNILGKLFEVNDDIDNEFEAHKIISQELKRIKDENNLDNYNISLFVKDISKTKWKQGNSDPNLFVKTFFNEINYCKETYGLSRSEVSFLYSIVEFILWEQNLLVDRDGLPMNQKKLCEVLGISRITVQNTVKSLEQKKCLVRIWDGRSVYFLVNPYLFFYGEKINKNLYEIFKMIGYISMKESSKINKKDKD